MRNHVADLGDLGIRQIRPLLISVVRRFPKTEARKAFQLAVSWCVRLIAADQLGRGALETEYESAALGVNRREITTAQGLAKKMKKASPDDKKFLADFSVFKVTNEDHARYLLRTLDVVSSAQKPLV